MGRGKLKISWNNSCRDEMKMVVRLDMLYVSIWEVVCCEEMDNNYLIKGTIRCLTTMQSPITIYNIGKPIWKGGGSFT